MQITLHNVIPTPLKDKIVQRGSDVWNKKIDFTTKDRVKIKAPSGTGKTTFTHIVYKLRSDFEGDVLWNNQSNKNINGDDLARFRQLHISIIFQDLRLFANLTAKENIELNRVLQKPFYEETMIDEMAEKLGITHILNQRAGLCSYGEQQRIGIIRALMQPFDILLMDEPFSHLDNNNTAIAANLIEQECAKRNAGFILTDLDEDSHFNYTKFYNL